jgi:mannobiose 2-epimerase
MTRAGRWTEPVSVLKQTLEVLFTRAVAPRECYAPDVFDLSWRPAADWRHRRRANYGHDAELAWLTLEALELVGWTHSCKRDRALDLVAHALTYGFDHARGGLAHYGPPAGATVHAAYLHPARLNKLWWPQAEMLVGLLDAYRLTRETRYLAAFVKQFEWVWERQIDHDGGEWFAEVTWRDGRPVRLTKGDDWKDPYHQSRGWMEVSRRLRAMGVA